MPFFVFVLEATRLRSLKNRFMRGKHETKEHFVCVCVCVCVGEGERSLVQRFTAPRRLVVVI